MNINSYSGGIFAASDPARFADGKLDLFRQKNLARATLKRGLRWRTEKTPTCRFHIPPSLPGSFCQYDGEARFVFSPSGEGVDFSVRCVMRIPVIIGNILEFRKGLDPPGQEPGPGFSFVGSEAERAQFKQRLEAWISGRLSAEMSATSEEAEAMSEHCERFLQSNCSRTAAARGRGGRGPHMQWMYEDAGFFPGLAKADPLRWSSRLCLDDAISEMEAETSGRPILLKVFSEGKEDITETFGDSDMAAQWMRSVRERDAAGKEAVQRRPTSSTSSSCCDSSDEIDEDCENIPAGSMKGAPSSVSIAAMAASTP